MPVFPLTRSTLFCADSAIFIAFQKEIKDFYTYKHFVFFNGCERADVFLLEKGKSKETQFSDMSGERNYTRDEQNVRVLGLKLFNSKKYRNDFWGSKM